MSDTSAGDQPKCAVGHVWPSSSAAAQPIQDHDLVAANREGCLLGVVLVEMLQPVVRALELRALREQNPESFDPTAALAAVMAAIAQDGLFLDS